MKRVVYVHLSVVRRTAAWICDSYCIAMWIGLVDGKFTNIVG